MTNATTTSQAIDYAVDGLTEGSTNLTQIHEDLFLLEDLGEYYALDAEAVEALGVALETDEVSGYSLWCADEPGLQIPLGRHDDTDEAIAAATAAYEAR